MSKKTNWKTILKLVQSRNHKIMSNEKNYTNVKSHLTFYCLDCETSFITTWASYKQASKSGCPTCKKNSISSFKTNCSVSPETKYKISQSNLGKPGSLLGKKGPEHPAWKGGTYDRLNGSSNDAYLWRKK